MSRHLRCYSTVDVIALFWIPNPAVMAKMAVLRAAHITAFDLTFPPNVEMLLPGYNLPSPHRSPKGAVADSVVVVVVVHPGHVVRKWVDI